MKGALVGLAGLVALACGCGESTSGSACGASTRQLTISCSYPEGEGGGFSIDMVAAPENAGTVYAKDGSNVFYKTTDGGLHWRTLPSDLVEAFAIDPRRPETLYAATNASGMMKSVSGGETWRSAGQNSYLNGLSGYAGGIAISRRSGTVYVDASHGTVFRSSDSGRSWKQASRGGTDTCGVSPLAVDPHTPRILYSGSIGVCESTNGGATWRVITQLPQAAGDALAVDPTYPTVVYAAGEAGVYKSPDAGKTWRFLGLAQVDVGALAIDPRNRKTIYAGGASGLYRSPNDGRTWQYVTRLDTHTAHKIGISGEIITSLAFVPSGRVLYIGTNEGGVFRITVGALKPHS